MFELFPNTQLCLLHYCSGDIQSLLIRHFEL